MLSDEVKVGIVFTLSLALLIFGVLLLKGYGLQRRGYTFYVLLEDASGLDKGDPVTVAGLKVGRVRDLKLMGRKVLVTVRMDRKVEVPKDSEFAVETFGAIGEKGIVIKLGEGPGPVEPGDTLVGKVGPGISDILVSVGSAGEQVGEVLRRLRAVLNDTTISQVGSAISEIRMAVEEARPKLRENLARLDRVLSDISEGAEGIKKLSEGGTAALRDIRASSASLKASAERLDSITASLDHILSEVRLGRGTLGRLLVEDELYESIRSLVAQMDSLVADIRRHPGRYIRIELF
ncbi:MAG TPA: MCE family protein [Candidatus Latescibacteria bacterium]|nr:MCE family protein [Candidatus Latescibacterota bacterium]